MNTSLTTPVVLFIYKRPDLLKQVFEIVQFVKPKKLFIIADGPKNQDEKMLCNKSREIVKDITWDCDVQKNYSDINLGCKKRVSSGLDWVFSIVEQAIILEDDCLPHSSFFFFCQELLEKYQDDERIMMISGSNFQNKWKENLCSYHFSFYGGIWGWATWRRAWEYYDVEMKLWGDEEIKKRIKDVISNDSHYRIRARFFDRVYCNNLDTWDYQWSFARLLQSGISIIPNVNLTYNLGFRNDATHTKGPNPEVENLDLHEMIFPLIHPKHMIVDKEYDNLKDHPTVQINFKNIFRIIKSNIFK